ncbi:uncharacterized protein SCODWIG_02896 [Saccharomycodes ludwigii]|uniref:Serine/threonine-protein phosphatase 4 regulatory subunit 2 n=1 Tax=Saccharomycodes ludwigii TaxID=36035 RepID=A0A376B8Z2_9ASCO|nr:hypothetical protein SCDLUD_000077 [Saccharomycodes ludwigii]KAH3902500.1 hypothetical protein SCDLUD_000077 [Saccharomycodes ludwigii]SSD61135.1 uncharacterized protein SCODWIG_02896 [Saccharomycodes ludwigii]
MNPLGIESKELYESLTTIVIDHNLNDILLHPSETLQKKFNDDLLQHLTITIPLKIFSETDVETINICQERLIKIANYLNEKFLINFQYPFTILRICELAYHPLQYFHIIELAKFVNALEDVCIVNIPWKPISLLKSGNIDITKSTDVSFDNENNFKKRRISRYTKRESAIGNKNDITGPESINPSLEKITWLNQDILHSIHATNFLKDIESIVSVNFEEYEEGDEEGEEYNDDETHEIENEEEGYIIKEEMENQHNLCSIKDVSAKEEKCKQENENKIIIDNTEEGDDDEDYKEDGDELDDDYTEEFDDDQEEFGDDQEEFGDDQNEDMIIQVQENTTKHGDEMEMKEKNTVNGPSTP